jgi:phosphoglycolate phosphatase
LRVALFDVDGTLLDADGAGRRALARAIRKEAGIPRLDAAYRLDGKTDPQIVKELLASGPHPQGTCSEETLRSICLRYVDLLSEELLRPTTHSLPGVTRLLAALDGQSGLLLGLLTGNVVQGARLKLRAAGLSFDRFRVGAFGSDSPDRMKLPAIARARAEEAVGGPVSASDLVIIGDTPADVRCGRGFGAHTIAVATGRYGVGQLQRAGAGHVFASMEDTDRMVAAVLRSAPTRPRQLGRR